MKTLKDSCTFLLVSLYVFKSKGICCNNFSTSREKQTSFSNLCTNLNLLETPKKNFCTSGATSLDQCSYI